MRAVELRAGGAEGLVPSELPDPEPGPGEVRIDLVAAALNRRDWWIRTGGKVRLPVVLGSDGAGIVSALGSGVAGPTLGDEVVIYPGIGWGAAEEAPVPELEILGAPSQGTYAGADRRCGGARAAAAGRLVVARDGSAPGCRPYGLARSSRYAGAGPGATILVTGGGGGVGTFAIQIGAALGARMLTTTSSPEKLGRLRELGAADGADYRNRGLARAPRPGRRRDRQRRRCGLAGRAPRPPAGGRSRVPSATRTVSAETSISPISSSASCGSKARHSEARASSTRSSRTARKPPGAP